MFHVPLKIKYILLLLRRVFNRCLLGLLGLQYIQCYDYIFIYIMYIHVYIYSHFSLIYFYVLCVYIFSNFLEKTIRFFSFAIKIIFPLGKSLNPLDTYIIVFCHYVYRIFEFIHSLHESSHFLHSKYFELSQRFSTLLTIKTPLP